MRFTAISVGTSAVASLNIDSVAHLLPANIAAHVAFALLLVGATQALVGEVREFRRKQYAGEDLAPAQSACKIVGLILCVGLFIITVAFLGHLALNSSFP